MRSQLLVNGGHGLSFVLNELLVERINQDLNLLLTVSEYSGVLASDGGRVDDVLKSSLVNSSQSSGSGSLLRSVGNGVLGLDVSDGNDNSGPLEFLLELLNNLTSGLLEGYKRSVRNANNEGLALSSVGLGELLEFGFGDENLVQIVLQFGVRHFRLLQDFADFKLQISWL